MPTIDELKGMASSKLGFARSNNFLIELPRLDKSSAKGGLLGGLTENLQAFIPAVPGLTKDSMPNSRELNTLCKGASLPSMQILTTDRRIGMTYEKVAYGYAMPEITVSFNMLNDYSVKNYFDEWQSQIFEMGYGENGALTKQVVGYKDDYAYPIKIHQLRKLQIGFSANLGPISGNIGFGGGSVYTLELIKAFPTQISEIAFSNEMDGLVEMSVTFSYTTAVRTKPSQNFINASIGI
jgi:hypothetical protein